MSGKEKCWVALQTRPSRALYPAPQQVPCFQCCQMCESVWECVHMCLSAIQQSKLALNAHRAWLERREKIWISQRFDTHNISVNRTQPVVFTSLVHIVYSAKCSSLQPHNSPWVWAFVKPSQCGSFPLSYIHIHAVPHQNHFKHSTCVWTLLKW